MPGTLPLPCNETQRYHPAEAASHSDVSVVETNFKTVLSEEYKSKRETAFHPAIKRWREADAGPCAWPHAHLTARGRSRAPAATEARPYVQVAPASPAPMHRPASSGRRCSHRRRAPTPASVRQLAPPPLTIYLKRDLSLRQACLPLAAVRAPVFEPRVSFWGCQFPHWGPWSP